MVRLSMLLAVRYPFILVLSLLSLAGLGALNGATAVVAAADALALGAADALALGAADALLAAAGADALGPAAVVLPDASVDAAFFLEGGAAADAPALGDFLFGAAGAVATAEAPVFLFHGGGFRGAEAFFLLGAAGAGAEEAWVALGGADGATVGGADGAALGGAALGGAALGGAALGGAALGGAALGGAALGGAALGGAAGAALASSLFSCEIKKHKVLIKVNKG